MVVFVVAVSLQVYLLPLSAPWYTWLEEHGVLGFVGVFAQFSVTFGVPLWLDKQGRKLRWWGSWTLGSPSTEPSGRLKNGKPPGAGRGRGFPGLALWGAGWLCLVLGTIGSLWGYAGLLTALSAHESWVFWVALSVVASATLPAGRSLVDRARRLRAHVLTSPADVPAGSYVLYLRPFEVDAGRARVEDLVGATGKFALIEGILREASVERQIAEAVRPVGALVGVGAPGERLPRLGACRMYLPHQGWQPAVAQLIEQARLVVLTLGAGAGTMWELAEAMRVLPPQRLLLVVPRMPKEDYDGIREQNIRDLRDTQVRARNPTWENGDAPALPPQQPGGHPAAARSLVTTGLIRFSSAWQPAFTEVNDPDRVLGSRLSLFGDLCKGLRPAFRQLIAYEREAGRCHG
ncbi:hypothetical protein M8542_33630 [Amycolatopsis sp. OK19-0408]|uniref:Uncharacterized protein n=1 Tax=Amycolatopsis iheyensis TaxID=2945988 RepID=A0A9X2SN66_9PSEU|nr:hypothetical protein [Amycolatopsis iheyensis]MCR6487778.1 hypothetical protein [Amycolatopsis iheyensis]